MNPITLRRTALAVTAVAFFVDTFLYCLLVPLLPRYAEKLNLNSFQVGVLFWSYALTLLIATPLVARFTDRWGRKMPMLLGLGGLAAGTLLFAYGRSFSVLFVARALQGIAGAATWLPGMALVADHYPRESRGAAMGIAFAGANLGLLLGPPVAGFMDHRFGPMAPFHLAIGLIALDAFARAFLLKEVEMVQESPIPWRTLLGNGTIRLFAGAAALGAALSTLLEAALPLDFHHRLGLNSLGIGLLFGAMALAHTLSSPWMGALSDRLGRVPVLRIGLLAALVTVPLPVLVPQPWAVALALMLLGLNLSFILSPCSPAVADQVERLGSQSFASGFSILNMAYSIGMVLGPLLGGVLIDRVGVRLALGLVGVGFASYTVIVTKTKKQSSLG
ncbi:MAG: MFS transporter [Firmicutes bacterium]|nr:MFS transporter [Bacillota bacterium]